MLFEDQDKTIMAPQKEIPITFRCDEKFRDWLNRQAGDLDCSASELIRAAVLLAVPQMKSIHGIGRIQLEDMREPEKAP